MLDQLCKMYVLKMIEEFKPYSDSEEGWYRGYCYALTDVLFNNGYTYQQINDKINYYKKELNLGQYIK